MFRILSLDGGGIKGAFTAAVLAELEKQLAGPVAAHFDLIVGTSTGGIIALGLGSGFTAERISELYESRGRDIFPPASSGFTALLERIFGTKYDSEDLRDILTEFFGPRLFMQLEHRLAITSFDAAAAQPVVFKTPYHPSLRRAHGDLSVVDVALATSAAPTYFPAADTDAGVMVDGGVWANCPVKVGVTEALSLFNKRKDEIAVLSIGTTHSPMFVERPQRSGGTLHWARPAVSLLMHATKQGALEQARKLCAHLVRIDVVVEPERFQMDDVNQVDDLVQLGRNAGLRAWEGVHPIFFGPRLQQEPTADPATPPHAKITVPVRPHQE